MKENTYWRRWPKNIRWSETKGGISRILYKYSDIVILDKPQVL